MVFYINDPKGYRMPYYPGEEWRKVTRADEVHTKEKSPFVEEVVTKIIKESKEAPAQTLPRATDRPLLAGQIMKSPVKVLFPDSTLEEAWELFTTYRFRHVPILNREGKMVGILSDRHILLEIHRNNRNKDHPPKLVKDIMVTNVLSATPTTEVSQIAKVFINEKIGSMPILDKDGTLCGILTRSDILRTLVKIEPKDLRI